MRPRNLLITLGVLVAVLVLPNLDALQSKARQTIASAAGKAAVTNMSGVVAENNARGLAAAELITLPIKVEEVTPGVFRASGVGNTFVITTSEGNVIFDTGLVIQASEQIRQLKAALGDFEPVKIVLSHSHADHVGGTRLWSGKHTELIAHEAFEEEQRYLTELNPYLHQRNRILFPWIPETPRTLPGMDFRGLIPDIRVDNDIPYTFTLGGVVSKSTRHPVPRGQTTWCFGCPTIRCYSPATSSGLSSRNFPISSPCAAKKCESLLST